MEMGDNFFFRGNATSVSLNVMIFKFCESELTGLSIFISLKKHFGDIERKTSVLVIFVFLLRISIYTVTTHKSLKYYGVTYVFVFCQNMGWHFIIKFMVCFLGTEYHRGLGLSQRNIYT